MTVTPLIIGVTAAAVFLTVLFIEGGLRPYYRSSYHTGSELTLGERGWVQSANFVQMGVGMFAFAFGVNRLEALRGDRRGQHSIRINDQYRICFRWTDSGPVDVEVVDYH
jgi:hypothetical protein